MKRIFGESKKNIKKFLQNFIHNYGNVFVIILVGVFFLISLYIFSIVHTTDKLRVTFFDVGQGDAIFIESPTRRQIIIDAGANDIVSRKIAKKINFFDKNIDAIIATHPDSDHITGFIKILTRYNIGNIVETFFSSKTDIFDILKNKISEENAEIFIASRGDKIDLGGGVTITFIYPNIYKNNLSRIKDSNEASLVALLNYKEINFLFTGDLPKEKENEIIASGLVPRNVTVLKVGHHGSNTSSGDSFINYLKPSYSILSFGKDNRYGHPTEAVVNILKKHSQNVMSTVDYGSISFETDGYNLKIYTEK